MEKCLAKQMVHRLDFSHYSAGILHDIHKGFSKEWARLDDHRRGIGEYGRVANPRERLLRK